VTFDPAVTGYRDLLECSGTITIPPRSPQGPDFGTQYRSAIFFHSPEQEAAARASLAEAQKRFRRPIVTQIVPAAEFWRAEEYHQQYLEKRGAAHCHF